MSSHAEPRVWALFGPHRGDNQQVLALAQALGLPFEEKQLSYNALRRVPPVLLGPSFRTVDRACRAQLEGEPPELTISTGLRSVPVVRELQRRSKGKLRTVHLGFPRIAPRHFDLVVPTPEYPVPDARNVMRIPFALTPRILREITPEDRAVLDALPRPRRLLLIGGPTLYWQLPTDGMITSLQHILDLAKSGGSVLAVSSPRTPPDLLAAVEREFDVASVPRLLAPMRGSPAYGALIDAADEIFVTADSVAMVADAVMTGKPVGLVPIARSALGRMAMAAMDVLRPGKRLYPRDLRFFWATLQEQGFGGTLEAPKASDPPDFAALVAERVRQLLEQPLPRATNGLGSDR